MYMTTTLNTEFTLPDIFLKNNLDKHNIYYNLIQAISNKIILIPEFHRLRTEIELIKLICNIVENSVVKSQLIDKKQLVIDIFQRVFNLSPVELELIKNGIEFIFNNKLIKKISYKKYIKSSGYIFLKKIIGL